MEEKKLTVIFTEDEKIIRDALIAGIDWEKLGVNVLLEASNAEELFALLRVNHVDLVFMDIRMPGMNGIEASRMLREKNPELHIIVLTSYNDFEYTREGLRIGIDDYLLKPVNPEEVEQAVQNVRKKYVNRSGLNVVLKKSMKYLQKIVVFCCKESIRKC